MRCFFLIVRKVIEVIRASDERLYGRPLPVCVYKPFLLFGILKPVFKKNGILTFLDLLIRRCFRRFTTRLNSSKKYVFLFLFLGTRRSFLGRTPLCATRFKSTSFFILNLERKKNFTMLKRSL